MNGATVNGRKPILSEAVHEYGHKSAARESAPKAAQVAHLNGKTQHGGHLAKPGESKPALAPNAGAERQNTQGTTAEEQKKRLASKMYPSSRGLREFMPKFF